MHYGFRYSNQATVSCTCNAAHRHKALDNPMWSDWTVEELMEIDQEGRTIITDHGAFILVNLYNLALTNEEKLEERKAIKMRLCTVSAQSTSYNRNMCASLNGQHVCLAEFNGAHDCSLYTRLPFGDAKTTMQ